MLAIALGLGADARFRQPMALAVSGGLLNSTALSLLVVPVVFSLLSDFEQANDHSDPGRIRTLWRG
jgi:multidrug efflux pump subunit AcrB